MKKVGLASDHAGFELKEFVKTWLTEKGYPCKDFGTYSTESCDYADYAHPLALAIEAGECGPGVAICGSGEGISMTLNKHQGIRAALCWIPEIAHLSRQHNDANVLVMPGRFIDHEMAEKILDEFFNSGFEEKMLLYAANLDFGLVSAKKEKWKKVDELVKGGYRKVDITY